MENDKEYCPHTTRIICGYRYIKDISTRKDMPSVNSITGKGHCCIQVNKLSSGPNVFCTITVDGLIVLEDVNIANFKHLEYFPYGEIFELSDIKFNEYIKVEFYMTGYAKENKNHIKMIAMLEG